MRQLINQFLWAALLAAGLQTGLAFSPAGPIGNGGDAWQVPVIGYGLPGDLVAPKNIGEEYRRNTPVLYYTCDVNFLEYFGSNGVVAVDGAFAILNALTNVSSYSSTLSEFPLSAQGINYTAAALGLTDLKSETLSLLMEQMGLAEPDRYTWTLHARDLPVNGKCPLDELYLVVQRNLDPVPSTTGQVQYSSYVNGTLYSYSIYEFCTGANPLAEAVEFPVDPFAQTYTAIASLGWGLGAGGYYQGLTRDDVGGLRYLLRTNNINLESPAAGALMTLITTNTSFQQLYPTNANLPLGYGTYDLGQLVSSSRTNDPATLQTLFPGVIVDSSFNYFILATNAVVSSYYTNYNGEPFGTAPHLKTYTNYTYYPQSIYVTTFANVVTNHYSSNTVINLYTATVAPVNGAPLGSPSKTNVTSKTITYTNVPSGDYYLLPPDQCPVNFVRTLQTNILATTNLITGVSTNLTTTNTTTAYAYYQYSVSYFTNYIYVVYPVDCSLTASNAAGLYQGIENVKFVRANYDSLIGQFFRPITNTYTMGFVANSKLTSRKFTRVVTTPDFLLTAQDLVGTVATGLAVPSVRRNLSFNQGNVLSGLAGPGTIQTPTVITYDKVGDIFENGSLAFNFLSTNEFLSEFTQTRLPVLTWASFDGTTNAPVLYPNVTSIDNLENQILVSVSPSPADLPSGVQGEVYPGAYFTATGGSFSPPFTWSLAPRSGSLPNGLFLSSGGVLSGTPTQSGTFDFIVELTDSLSRTVQWNYTLIIQ